jgi:HD-like signal output (HDOD) protein
MKADRSLRAVAAPLDRLWEKSLAVASICQVVARGTNVRPEEAFLTGLLHGIGRLYIMVRAAESQENGSTYDDFVDLVADWHPSIGKAVLENWGFLEEMAEAVAHQADHESRPRHDPDLTDILIVSVLLAEVLGDGKTADLGELLDVPAFVTLGLGKKDCALILKHAYHQLGSLHEVLGR